MLSIGTKDLKCSLRELKENLGRTNRAVWFDIWWVYKEKSFFFKSDSLGWNVLYIETLKSTLFIVIINRSDSVLKMIVFHESFFIRRPYKLAINHLKNDLVNVQFQWKKNFSYIEPRMVR